MSVILKQSTEIKVRIGPFVDATDGLTPETGITLGTADEAELLKANGAATVDISGATWAAITGSDGWYDLTLTASHTDTVGELVVIVQDDSVCLPVFCKFQVVEEAIYDAFYASGSTGLIPVNVTQISGDSTAADNLELMFDGTGYTDATAPASRSQITALNDLDSAAVQTAAAAALTAYDPPTKAELDTAESNIRGVDSDTLKSLSDQIDGISSGSSPQLLQNTTITVSTQTEFTLGAGSADDDAYNGAIAIITDQATGTQKAFVPIIDYVGSTRTVTLLSAPVFTIATGDTIDIVAGGTAHITSIANSAITSDAFATAAITQNKVSTGVTVSVLGTSIRTELGMASADLDAQLDAIVADTNELQTDWANDGRLDLILDARASQASVDGLNNISTAQVNAEVDAALADYDAPTKAEMDSAFSTVNSTLSTISGHTSEIGPGGSGLFQIPWNSVWDIEVESECIDALNSYDPPTKAELDSGFAALNDLDSTAVQSAAAAALTAYDPPTKAELDTAESNIRGADSDTLKTLSDQLDAFSVGSSPQLLQNTTITVSTQTEFTLAAGSADDDAYNGAVAIITDQSTSTQKSFVPIADYVGSSKTVTLATAPAFTIATGDTIDIIAAASDAPTAAAIRAEIDSNSTQLAAIVADTNELQSDWTNNGRLDLILDELTTQGDTNQAAISSLNNLSAAQVNAEVDAALADYDAPTKAELDTAVSTIRGADSDTLKSLSDQIDGVATQSSVNTIDGIVDTILINTNTIGTAGSGLTGIPWNPLWDAEVQSECADALTAYDPPTKAELDSGFSALNNLSAAQVNAEVDAALADYDGPTNAEMLAAFANVPTATGIVDLIDFSAEFGAIPTATGIADLVTVGGFPTATGIVDLIDFSAEFDAIPTVSEIRTGLGLASANLDTQLSSIAAAIGASGTSVASVHVASLSAAALAQMGGVIVRTTIPSSTSTGFNLPIIRGDTYSGSTLLTINVGGWNGPAISGANELVLSGTDGRTTFEWPLSYSGVYGTDDILTLSLTSTQTDLKPGTYVIDAQATYGDGSIHTFYGPQDSAGNPVTLTVIDDITK